MIIKINIHFTILVWATCGTLHLPSHLLYGLSRSLRSMDEWQSKRNPTKINRQNQRVLKAMTLTFSRPSSPTDQRTKTSALLGVRQL